MAKKPSKAKAPPKKAPAKKQRAAQRLTEAQKDEITMRLAMYDTPQEIADGLLDENNKPLISRQAIAKYDPYVHDGYQKRKDLFDHTRKAFLEEVSSEPIANQAYRIRRLGMLHHAALRARDLKEARMALEQAAKEVGDVYTKAGQGSGLIPVIPVDGAALETYSLDEKRNMLADRLAPLFAKPAKLLTPS